MISKYKKKINKTNKFIITVSSLFLIIIFVFLVDNETKKLLLVPMTFFPTWSKMTSSIFCDSFLLFCFLNIVYGLSRGQNIFKVVLRKFEIARSELRILKSRKSFTKSRHPNCSAIFAKCSRRSKVNDKFY